MSQHEVDARRAAELEPSNWRRQFGWSVASWGDERLRACSRTLALRPDFVPARLNAAMVLVARQAFGPALAAAEAGGLAKMAAVDSTPFSSLGIHWLRGLLLLREGRVGAAIQAFVRELDELADEDAYATEVRVNAQVAAGYAHLAVDDTAGAVDAFRMSLESLPRNGRALVGMYQALRSTSLALEAERLIPQIRRAVAELEEAERDVEAALLSAAADVVQGHLDAAVMSLQRLLETAAPGQAGWMIPIDPSLAALRDHRRYPELMALLAHRAA